MCWIRAMLGEAFGLLVDDGLLAAAAVIWLALVWLVFPRLGVGAVWSGPLLFAGLAAILLESVVRRGAR